MNMGIADAWDLGWKLASVINGSGGEGLLESYEAERKPVAVRNVQRSGDHFKVHLGVQQLLVGSDPRSLGEEDDEAQKVRHKIHEYYQQHDGENKDFGIEMGYRYKSSVIVCDQSGPEPEWTPSKYTPTTWPGGRPPHVFLSDGSPIFDHFGKHWTLVDFSRTGCGGQYLVEACHTQGTPLAHINLVDEEHARKLYERPLVLLRPDQHVAWRGDSVDSLNDAERIVRTVTGRMLSDS